MSETYMDWRDYAVELVEDGMVSRDTMITALLKYLSDDEVKEMLEANELMPEDGDFDDYNYVGSPMHY